MIRSKKNTYIMNSSEILKISKLKSYHRCLPLLVKLYKSICNENSKYMISKVSPFDSMEIPDMSIKDLIIRLCKYAYCSKEVFIYSIILIDRYCLLQQVLLTYYNIHRLLITAFIISCKMRDDVYYHHSHYGKIIGLTVREINSLEMTFLTKIDWDIYIRDEDYNIYVTEIYKKRY